jgi:hypothetical protein
MCHQWSAGQLRLAPRASSNKCHKPIRHHLRNSGNMNGALKQVQRIPMLALPTAERRERVIAKLCRSHFPSISSPHHPSRHLSRSPHPPPAGTPLHEHRVISPQLPPRCCCVHHHGIHDMLVSTIEVSSDCLRVLDISRQSDQHHYQKHDRCNSGQREGRDRFQNREVQILGVQRMRGRRGMRRGESTGAVCPNEC